MSKRADAQLLADIKEAAFRTKGYTRTLTYQRFLRDKKTQDAVVRNLEIIGEAAKNISDALKEKYPQVPWKELAGVRDKLIHHYFGVNLEVVWDIVKQELPVLVLQLEAISRAK